jgi:hypothetical protein
MLLTLTADRWCALLGFFPSCHGHTRFHTHDQPSAFDLSVGGSSSPIYFAANKELNEFAKFSAAKTQSRRTLHTYYYSSNFRRHRLTAAASARPLAPLSE